MVKELDTTSQLNNNMQKPWTLLNIPQHSGHLVIISLRLLLRLFLAFDVFDGFKEYWSSIQGFPGGSVIKNLPAKAGDAGSNPGLGRSLGETNGNPLQYSCLENPLDTGGWVATAHGVTGSGTRLSAQVYCTYA